MSSDIERHSDEDNVPDHEPGLFNDDEDVDRGGEGMAEEAVEVPGPTQMNETANLEMPGGAEEKKKRVIKNPQPKLDAERIMGPRGVQKLEDIFKDWTPKGPGYEFDDLDVVMYKLNHWAHRLYPKLPFDETLNIIANRLGNKKVVTTHVKKIRMGMVNPTTSRDQDEIPEDNDVARYDLANLQLGDQQDMDETERYGNESSQAADNASQQDHSVRTEQLERMRRNKELALQKRREREELKKKAIEEERMRVEEEEEIMRDMEENSPSFPTNPSSQSKRTLSPEKEKNPQSSEAKDFDSTSLPDSEATPFVSESRIALSPEKEKERSTIPEPDDCNLDWDKDGDTKEPDTDMLSLDQMMEEMEEEG